MCGTSKSKIKNEQIGLFIGYYGGSIDFTENEFEYADKNFHYKTDKTCQDREKSVKYMQKYTKTDLINMIADFVENADEA